jgi:hypothetical protein
MDRQAEVLKDRTKQFAFTRHPCHSLLTIGSGRNNHFSSAVAFWDVGRARSRREFLAKLAVVIEEADESAFWLELLDAGLVPEIKLKALRSEAN